MTNLSVTAETNVEWNIRIDYITILTTDGKEVNLNWEYSYCSQDEPSDPSSFILKSMRKSESFYENVFFDDEEVIQSYQFIRDQIILTNYGIYEVDVQGLSGKKVEVKFFPKDTIKTISFETAGTLDFDVDIKIGVTNNTVVNVDGAAYSEPLSFKVPSSQAAEAKEVVRLVKEHYLF